MKSRLCGKIFPSFLVRFYRFWHGRLRLPGAGFLLHRLAAHLPGLQKYPLTLPSGGPIHIDFRDVSAFSWQNHLLGDSFEEQGLLSAILKRRKSRGVCWDVGANGGLFSYLLAKQARPMKIEFFEPQAKLYRMASEALSSFQGVRGHNCALSSRIGKSGFYVPKGESTKAHLKEDSAEMQGGAVHLETGDSLVNSGLAEPPDLLKIDTEGHENLVLAGLVQSLRLRKADIFLEHLSLGDAEMSVLCPPGYRPFTVSNDSGILVKGLHRELGHNSAFLPNEDT